MTFSQFWASYSRLKIQNMDMSDIIVFVKLRLSYYVRTIFLYTVGVS